MNHEDINQVPSPIDELIRTVKEIAISKNLDFSVTFPDIFDFEMLDLDASQKEMLVHLRTQLQKNLRVLFSISSYDEVELEPASMTIMDAIGNFRPEHEKITDIKIFQDSEIITQTNTIRYYYFIEFKMDLSGPFNQ